MRSQITFNLYCFLPSFSHESSFSRPSTNNGDPLLKYSLANSAVRPHNVTSTKVVSSTHSPLAFLRRSFTAKPISLTAVPLGI